MYCSKRHAERGRIEQGMVDRKRAERSREELWMNGHKGRSQVKKKTVEGGMKAKLIEAKRKVGKDRGKEERRRARCGQIDGPCRESSHVEN